MRKIISVREIKPFIDFHLVKYLQVVFLIFFGDLVYSPKQWNHRCPADLVNAVAANLAYPLLRSDQN